MPAMTRQFPVNSQTPSASRSSEATSPQNEYPGQRFFVVRSVNDVRGDADLFA
jgi:hypothetical protein